MVAPEIGRRVVGDKGSEVQGEGVRLWKDVGVV